MVKLFNTTLLALALAATAAASGQATGKRPAAQRQTPAGARPTPPPARPATAPAAQTPPAAATATAPGSVSALCGCEDKPLPAVLAVVNGVKITPADLSPETQQRVEQYQREVIEARKNELNLQINSILLEAEARKRGVTTTKLLEDEVVSKTVNPTEADARAYFEQNRARIESQAGRTLQFEEIKPQVVNYLLGQRQQEAAQRFSERLRAASDVKVNVAEPTPPATAADRARVFATVAGRNITSGDVEDALRPLIASVQEAVYTLRNRDLEMKINDILLEAEAQKRGMTARALLDAEVNTKQPVVTEAQALDFYNKNKERVNGDFAQLKYQIIEFLENQERAKLNESLADRLRGAAQLQSYLTPPVQPVYDISTADQPSKGNAAAKVTVVEFTDFQCPSCAQAQPVIERLIAEYGDRVRFVVRDFPLAQHADARKAAEAAEAAREQGKFWEYVPLLFRNQSALSVANLKQYATSVGLDRAKFDAALDSGKFAAQVERDLLDGQRVGVSGTPTLFVNGRRVNGITYEAIKAAIDEALKTAK
ncbi:MAG TPA: thioredoxin domain-containing protein [Pyrinomonadaceae bacterium]|nr:thioredoxin domain-containing protein [Pyrinomonadaceae bacterium]